MFSSFHIEFHELYRRIFVINPTITTDSDRNVISRGGRQCHVEPRWWVEGATGVSGTTPLSIPQGVTVCIEKAIGEAIIYACLTKVVLAHKRRNTVSSSASRDTGTCVVWDAEHFIKTINKAPDVLAGRPMRDTYSINIVSIRAGPLNASGEPNW